jgi:hypothetical protein
VIYPIYLLALPIAFRYRSYLLLLLIPLWRNRREGPVMALIDHFVLSVGVLKGLYDIFVAPRVAALTTSARPG